MNRQPTSEAKEKQIVGDVGLTFELEFSRDN